MALRGEVREIAAGMDQALLRNAMMVIGLGAASMAFGFALGIIFAPFSGYETRTRISKMLGQAGNEVQQATAGVAEQVAKAGSQAQDTVQSVTSRFLRSV